MRECIFVSKIVMGLKKSLFAKPLPKLVKLMTALRITSKTYCRGRFNLPSVFFALNHNYDEGLTTHQMNAIGGTSYSRKTAYEMREFFIDIYNDEQLILDFLNKEISERYFSKLKEKAYTEQETDVLINVIFDDNDMFGLINEMNL